MIYGPEVRRWIVAAIEKTARYSDLPPDLNRTLASLGYETPESLRELQRELAREIYERFRGSESIGLDLVQIHQHVSDLMGLETETTVLEIAERLMPVFDMLMEGSVRQTALADAEPTLDDSREETSCEADLPGDSTIFGDPD